jgi:hypothetical protein
VRSLVFQRLRSGSAVLPKSIRLRALDPTQTELPFAIAQIVVLVMFVVLSVFAVKKFRVETKTAAKSSDWAA